MKKAILYLSIKRFYHFFNFTFFFIIAFSHFYISIYNSRLQKFHVYKKFVILIISWHKFNVPEYFYKLKMHFSSIRLINCTSVRIFLETTTKLFHFRACAHTRLQKVECEVNCIRIHVCIVCVSPITECEIMQRFLHHEFFPLINLPT